MRTALRAFLLAFVASLALAAPAAHAAAHKTSWTCWLHADTRVACAVLEAADTLPAAAAAAPQLPALSAAQLMQAVRARPSSTAGQLVFVPLWGVPFDESMVEQLVSSVLCGSTPDCAARYQPELRNLIAESPEAFADMLDPVLVAQAL